MWKLRKSNRDNVVYAPLQQTFSDDDDFEDEILFDQDLNISSASLNGTKRFGRDVIELENLQGSRLKLRDRRRADIAVRSGGFLSKKTCVVLTVVIIVASAVCAGVLYPRYFSHSHSPSNEWSLSFGNYVSDSCIRLVDVDNDGQLDILLSLATPDYNHHYDNSMGVDNRQLNESCKEKGLSHPCTGQLLAIRGYDGKELWQLSTKSSILYIHCDQLDADEDGHYDCLISGYHATLQAVNPRNGSVIWSADTKDLIDQWNIYQALVVPDVDQDNVDDVLILHSECYYYSYSKPPTGAGRFLLFSGATGHTLGTFVNITIMEGGGAFMNPVLYKSSNNTLNVLFGNGQLSSPGGLHQIYWDALRKQLLDPQVKVLSETKMIYKSMSKGILVPPVIVDVHDDGMMDILMSAFDGNLILYDGRTFKVKWKVNFDGYESFSIPAPGYFNNDAYLDFMMHLNYGTWPTYTYSMMVVVSGKDGAVLWKMASSFPSFTSDLTLQMVKHQRDVFVFKTFDREGPVYVDSKGNLNGVSDRTFLPKQPGPVADILGMADYPGGYSRVCTFKVQSSVTEEVFIMDRSNMDKPILLAENQYFPFPASTSDQHLCVIVKPVGRGTGAIGDVDGDDQPDYISLTNLAMVGATATSSSDIRQNVTLHKRALTSAVRSSTQVPLKIFSSLSKDNGDGGGDEGQHDGGLESTGFVPQREQVWTEYFGRKQSGVYRRQHLSDGGNTMSRRSRVLYYLVVLFTLLVVLL